MATRIIRVMGDPVLNKKAKTVTDFGEKTIELIEDMLDTMYELPEDDSVEKIIIDKDVVNGLSKPRIIKKEIA